MNTEQMKHLARLLTSLADDGLEVNHLRYNGSAVGIYVFDADELRTAARTVKSTVGPLAKEQGDDGIELVGTWHDIEVRIQALGGVCKRVQVGTRTVTRPDPDAPMVEVEEPVYEVRCPDSVLADLEPEAVPA